MNKPKWQEDLALKRYFVELGDSKPLSSEDEQRLTHQIKLGDQAAEHELIKANLRFVVDVAKQYQHRGLTVGELVSAGNMGLMRAAQKFDETKGFRFISYAVWWIRQAILQELAEQSRTVRLPINRVDLLRRIHRELNQESEATGDIPSPDEVAQKLGVSVDEVVRTLADGRSILSLNATFRDDNDDTLADILGDDTQEGADDLLFRNTMVEEVDWAVSTLEDREAEVLRLYFGLGGIKDMTLEEIGVKLGITRERVRQIKEKAIEKLRHASRSRRLKPYADDTLDSEENPSHYSVFQPPMPARPNHGNRKGVERVAPAPALATDYTQTQARAGWIAIIRDPSYSELHENGLSSPSKLTAAVNRRRDLLEEDEDPLDFMLSELRLSPDSAGLIKKHYPAVAQHCVWLDQAIATKTLLPGFPGSSGKGDDMGGGQDSNTPTWEHLQSKKSFQEMGFKDHDQFVQELVACGGNTTSLVRSRVPGKFSVGLTPRMITRYAQGAGLLTPKGELTASAKEKAATQSVPPPPPQPLPQSLAVTSPTNLALSATDGGLAKSMVAMLAAATHSSESVPLAPGIETATRASILRTPMAILVSQFGHLLPFVDVAEKALALVQLEPRLRQHIESNPADALMMQSAELLVQAGKLIRSNGQGG